MRPPRREAPARSAHGVCGAASAAQGVLEPPHQRANPQGQELGEMVAVAEAPLRHVGSVRQGVLVEPEELAVAGEQLHDAEGGHDHGRQRAPAQQPLHVLDVPDPLHGDEKQQAVVEKDHQGRQRFGRRQGDAGPGPRPGGTASAAAPQRQDLGGVGRQPRQQPRRQGRDLHQQQCRPQEQHQNRRNRCSSARVRCGAGTRSVPATSRLRSSQRWADQAQAAATASTVSASCPSAWRPPINSGTRKITPARLPSTTRSNNLPSPELCRGEGPDCYASR